MCSKALVVCTFVLYWTRVSQLCFIFVFYIHVYKYIFVHSTEEFHGLLNIQNIYEIIDFFVNNFFINIQHFQQPCHLHL